MAYTIFAYSSKNIIIITILCVISDCKDNDTEGNVDQTMMNLKTSLEVAACLNIENRGKFEIGESSKSRILEENEITTEEDNAESSDYSNETELEYKCKPFNTINSSEQPSKSKSNLGESSKSRIKENEIIKEENGESSDYPNEMKLEYKFEEEMENEKCFSVGFKIECKPENGMTEDDREKKSSRNKINQWAIAGQDQSAIIHEVETYCEEWDKSFNTNGGSEQPSKPKSILNVSTDAVHEVEYRKFNQSQRTMECRECQKYFSSFMKLDNHFQNVHPGRKMYKCEVCFKEFSQYRLVKRHEDSIHRSSEYSCKFCNKKWKRHDSWKRHEKSCKAMEKPTQEEVQRRQLSNRHKFLHKGKRMYEWEQCSMKFIKYTNIQRHENAIHGSRFLSMECGECQKDFSSYNKLDVHFKYMHPGRKMYKCETCSMTFSLYKNLKRHQLTIHISHLTERREWNGNTTGAINAMAKRGGFRCLKCDEIFELEHYTSYIQHLEVHDSDR